MKTPSLVLVGLIAAMARLPGQPADVAGWHGAEWGMSEAQTRAALAPLDLEPATGECAQADALGLRAKDTFDVDSIQAHAVFCFSGQPAVLRGVMLDFGEQVGAFERIRDQLKANYGAPTSESNDRFAGGNVLVRESKWVLAKTEIRCTSNEITNVQTHARTLSLLIIYSKRKPSIL